MNTALQIVIEEAVRGRNYYTGENYFCREDVERLAAALQELGVRAELQDEMIVILPGVAEGMPT